MEWTDRDVRTWKREDKAGVYYVMIPGTAKWRSSGHTRKSLAIEWALREATGGKHPAMAFGEYAKDFFIPGLCRHVTLVEGSRGPNSLDHWEQLRQILEDYVLPRWGSTPLALIPPSEVYAWLSAPSLTTVRQTRSKPRVLSAIWRNRILTVMTKVFDQATFEQVVPANPMTSVPRLAADSKERCIFTDSEMQMLFPAAPDRLDEIWRGRLWALLAMVLADTGVRPGEGLALRKKHWHPESRAFIVAEAVKEGGAIGAIKTAKKGVARKVGLVSPRTAGLLEDFVATMKPDDLLFASFKFERTRGQAMRTVTFTHHFEKVLIRAGVPANGRTPYSLRHTANTDFRTNLDDEAARLLMGHTTKAMTEQYDHPDDEALIRRAVRAVELARR